MKADLDTQAAAPSPARPRAGLGRNVVVLGITSLLTDMSSEMTITLLPLVLANVLGATTLAIGLVEGVAETTSSIGRIFSGWFSDLIGRRKWLTVAGYSVSSLSKPLLYFAASWAGVLVLRFADRVGKGIRTAPRDALIADAAPEGRRGLNFGFHRAADTAGAMLGLVLAAIVVYFNQHLSVDISRSTYQTLVLIATIPAVLAVVVLVLFVRENRRAPSHSKAPSLALKGFDPRFKAFLVIAGLFALGNSADAFLVLRAQNLGLPLFEVVLALVLFNGVYAVIATPAGHLSDRLGRKRLLAVGWLVYSAIYFGFGLSNQSWQVWPLFAVYGIYYGIAEGVAKALVADVVMAGQRGTAYGAYNMVVGVIVLPASLVAGLLWQGLGSWQGFGASAPFYFGSVVTALAVLLLVFWLPRVRVSVSGAEAPAG